MSFSGGLKNLARMAIASLLGLCGARMPRRSIRGAPKDCVLFRPPRTEMIENPPGRIVAILAPVAIARDELRLVILRGVLEAGAAADAHWVVRMQRSPEDDPVLVHLRPQWPGR